jgi:hypothetical protein
MIASCARSVAVENTRPSSQAAVRPGIDVLLAGDMAALKGMRVGLITNHTGKTLDGRSTIDALAADTRIKLVALFAPEHGIRGTVDAGGKIDNERDTITSGTPKPAFPSIRCTAKPTGLPPRCWLTSMRSYSTSRISARVSILIHGQWH